MAQLVEAYERGGTVQEVASRFRLHRTTVLEHLHRAGVPRRANVRKLTTDRVHDAAKLYESGLSLAAVGDALAVNAQTIRRELKRAGVPVWPRRGSMIDEP